MKHHEQMAGELSGVLWAEVPGCRDMTHSERAEVVALIMELINEDGRTRTFYSFQEQAMDWARSIFSRTYINNRRERAHRFLEEALEVAQASDCSHHDALQLVNYVYGRPKGQVHEEIGDVMVALSVLAEAHCFDVGGCADKALALCIKNKDKIAAKQAAKHDNSALPGGASPGDLVIKDTISDDG